MTETAGLSTVHVGIAAPSDMAAIKRFVDTFNEGMLFGRRVPELMRAANAHRLLVARAASPTGELIGTVVVSDDVVEPTLHTRTTEIGGLLVHPHARGRRVAGLLTRLALLHDLSASSGADGAVTYVAHFVLGNDAPREAFRAAGFEPQGIVEVHPGDVDADISTLAAPGAHAVRMRSARFDPKHLAAIVDWYRTTLRSGVYDAGRGRWLNVRFDELSAEIPIDHISV
ncbi:MAG: GNAT family N-acetyltransferase [Actinomycetota bacterium]